MKKSSMQVNSDFFENIVACQCLTNAYYTSLVLEHLTQDAFKNPGNRLVVNIIKDFYSKRRVLPTITEIKTYLNKEEDLKLFKDTVTTYKQYDTALNMEELIANTEQFFKEKAVYNTVLKIVDDVSKEKADYPKFLSWFEKACNISLVSDIGLDFFGEYEKIITELGTKNETIPTGWGFIDDKIGGGLMKNGRALYLFLGPTNVGKSIFLGNVAANIANRGLTTVLISLEMPEMMYAKRISSHLSKIPINNIQDQIITLDTYFKGVTDSHKRKLIIKEFPPKSITVSGIKAYLESLVKAGIKPDILVIDYLGLIKASQGDNSYEQGKVAAEELRALSYFFNMPVVSAIQTNREGMEKPSLDTVSESLGVAFTADVVWAIYQEDGDQETGIIKVAGVKNRLGPKHGATAMRIDYTTLSLSEEKGYIGLTGNKSGSGVDEVMDLENKLEMLELSNKHIK
jgi:replicative DNA helicase